MNRKDDSEETNSNKNFNIKTPDIYADIFPTPGSQGASGYNLFEIKIEI